MKWNMHSVWQLFFILLFQMLANIWKNKIKRYLCRTEYMFYFILILYFKNNGMSSKKNKTKLICCIENNQIIQGVQ